MMKYKIYSTFLFFAILMAQKVQAQKEIDIPVNHLVVLNFVDHVVYANIITSEKKIKPNLDLYYFWYGANDIKRTRGGFDGKLLHGEYIEFYPDKNLKEKGAFRYGLKHGFWKTWYQSGEIASIVKWKNGKMNGDFRFFDQEGNLTQKGCYKEDVFHGSIDTYLPDGKTESCKYKNGEKRIAKKSFYKKWLSKKDKKSAKSKEIIADKQEEPAVKNKDSEIKSETKEKTKKASSPPKEKDKKKSKEKKAKTKTAQPEKPKKKDKKEKDSDNSVAP